MVDITSASRPSQAGPRAFGLLAADDRNRIYWEEWGSPDGIPAVFLHGGPGAGCTASQGRLFDPRAYRVVLFDQRGCGRSEPHASDAGVSLADNTTWHLVADMESLRAHLGIERWLVVGGSWGSALALAYAERHPERVIGLLLRGVFTASAAELDWYFGYGAPALFPDAWERLAAAVDADPRSDIMAAYRDRLNSPDAGVRIAAAQAWSVWAGITATLRPDPRFLNKYARPRDAVAFGRIQNHYFSNYGFFSDDQLLAGVGAIRHLPAVIVQGRYDVITPVANAWRLCQAWPEAALRIVPDAGHTHTEPGIRTGLITAIAEFAATLSR